MSTLPTKKKKKKKPRCHTCNKKLKFGCSYTCSACPHKFCAAHRYASEHGCGEAIAQMEREKMIVPDAVKHDKV